MNRKLQKLYRELFNEINFDLYNLGEKYNVKGREMTISDLNKYKRLFKLRQELGKKIGLKYTELNQIMLTELKLLFKSTFYDTIELFRSKDRLKFTDVLLKDEVIETALNHEINKLTLSDRLERNRKKIIKSTIQTISKSLVLGQGVQKMSNNIKKLYDGDLKKSKRIARTETTRILNRAKHEGYKEARKKGISFIEIWLPTNDSRTRDKHRDLKGVKKNKDGYFHINSYKAKYPGDFGVAEMDINCRCTTIIEFT